jgi:predicted N-acetyltransferase YhbS
MGFWPILVQDMPALLLGPVAVHPTHQGEGLGRVLIRDSLAAALRAGWARVLLVGDAPYYGRFGFERLDGVEMPPPTNPERVLGRALTVGAWDGVSGVVFRQIDRTD